MSDSAFESRVLAFERLWLRHGPCDLAAFLDASPALTGQAARLLLEMICIDLEFRWRSARVGAAEVTTRTVEEYLAEFPRLGADGLPLELVAQEYRVRSQWGDRPRLEEYLLRFPAQCAALEQALRLVDQEIDAEQSVITDAAERESVPRVDDDAPAQVYDTPLLSYRDFLLRRMIGAGRVGKVYEALQHSTGRSFAIKFLRKSFLKDPRAVARFVEEARIVARLRHEHIIGIEGLGRTPAGGFFLVIELVRGPNLDVVLRTKPLPVSEAARLTIDLCAALEHAHGNGVVHCDLKPANLLLGEQGRLKVTDFGLARDLHEQAAVASALEGTAPYMAPEQVSRHFGTIDERTDIYGAGAVLYTLLSGRPPWLGTRLPDVLAQVVSAATPPPPHRLRSDVPTPLNDLCMKCLSKQKNDRFRTIREMRTALLSTTISAPSADSR